MQSYVSWQNASIDFTLLEGTKNLDVRFYGSGPDDRELKHFKGSDAKSYFKDAGALIDNVSLTEADEHIPYAHIQLYSGNEHVGTRAASTPPDNLDPHFSFESVSSKSYSSRMR